MIRRTAWPVLAILLLATAISARAKLPSGKSIIGRVQQAYDEQSTLRFRFRQETSLALIDDQPTVTEGTMELAGNNRFRLETPEMIVVSDGKTLWRYNPTGNPPTVIVESLGDVEPGMIPREILFEYPKKFTVTEVDEGTLDRKPVYILDLVPKEEGIGVKRIKVWVDEEDAITRKMELVDDADNLTVFTLTNVERNVEIADARFRLTIPDGVKVYDLR